MSTTREGGCPGTRPFFVSAAAVAILIAAGCSSKPPLANTYGSPDALATAVLDALRAGDRGRLEMLALSELEFRDHVWPDLPAARPERNLPFSYVWRDLHQKSQLALSTTLRERGGRQYQFVRVAFAGTTDYAHYRVHHGSRFHVRDDTDHQADIRVCGSFIEKDGAWKVFSYVVD